ncbi:MAG: hypothetical protein C0606_17700 [Hyphomicrobiales bacterium]|nr:MAG: hypothetical protein C0606_17700 [Hyphomicrobiales bacterium]
MKVQCDCGRFQAELTHFPKHSPGRLVCYCDDCQTYLKALGREDLLDPYGGTEIVPVYPDEFKIVAGAEVLRCNRLSKRGLSRWSATCCNSPIANVRPKFPWVGILHNAYTVKAPDTLEKAGPIRSRIMGKFKRGTPPFEISEKIRLRDILVIAPFLLRGFLFKKHRVSPFFREDGVTPVCDPVILDT